MRSMRRSTNTQTILRALQDAVSHRCAPLFSALLQSLASLSGSSHFYLFIYLFYQGACRVGSVPDYTPLQSNCLQKERGEIQFQLQLVFNRSGMF